MIYANDYTNGQHCPRKVDGKLKSRIRRRPVGNVTLVCIHATGIGGGGGYGVGKHLRARVRRELGEDASEQDVTLAALRERYRRTTYHGIYRPADEIAPALSLVQWPAVDHTYHGNNTNAVSIAWAIGGLWTPDHQDPLNVDDARDSLRHTIEQALEQGAPLEEITAHANHSRKPNDPGPLVWREVVRPVAEAFGLLVRPEWTTGKGSPTIAAWDAIETTDAQPACGVAS